MEFRRRYEAEKLTVEQYFDFVHHHNNTTNRAVHLTVSHLNEIIEMHGFKKLHKTQKSIMVEAVNAMDLMDPTRSTVEEDSEVAPCPSMGLEEAKSDLAELKWQECSVTSVETLNASSVTEKPVVLQVSPKSKLKRKTSRKGKPRKVMKLGEVGSSAAGGAAATAVGGRREKLVPRRRRGWTSVDSFEGISL